MKDLVLKAFLTIAVVVAVAATASAQTANLKVNIPFNFMAGDHSLSTGTYTIRTLNPSLVQLLDQNGHAWNVTTIREDLPRPEKEGRLHFNKYGNQYFSRSSRLGRPVRQPRDGEVLA